MSRLLTENSYLNGAIPIAIVGNFSMFAWVKSTDFAAGAQRWYMQSATNPTVRAGPRASEMRLNHLGSADAIMPVSDVHNNQWLPVMITHTGTQATLHFVNYTAVTQSKTITDMPGILCWGFPGISVRYGEFTIWDRIITAGEFATLQDVSGGDAINPATLYPSDVVNYISWRADSFNSEAGSQSAVYVDEPIGISSFDVDHPPVALLAPGGPVHVGPDPVDNKVGEAVNIDVHASDWFTSSGGDLVYTAITEGSGDLPAGLSMTGGTNTAVITGTLTEAAGQFTSSITAADDNGSTVGVFSWDITEWQLVITNADILENKDGTSWNTGSTVNATVFDGDAAGPGDTLTNATQFSGLSISNGGLTIAPVTQGVKTVLIEDASATPYIPLTPIVLTPI